MFKMNIKKLIVIIFFSIFILLLLCFLFFKINAGLSQKEIDQKLEANRDLINQLISDKETEREDYSNSLTFITDEESKTIIPQTTDSSISGPTTDTFTIEDDVSLPHILDNNDKAYYLNFKSSSWHLEKGDTLEIEIYADEDYFNSPGSLIFGYCLNKQETSIEQFRINKYKKITFKASTPGDYSFYLHCVSSDPIIIEGVVIK
ncbi:hypothetical protein Ami103574_13810 [Aminipila butyrica]|uniref:Uncharacterized protein n=1 Tax=Aminipila butyrica TaxID=433296 RepID=A0A858BZE6_9FIRM|nr:hypothetical protein [Aminipila butyrica]QIB70300.1 hypothetical protein Ami103574_13810 [Aminipila butyrica]